MQIRNSGRWPCWLGRLDWRTWSVFVLALLTAGCYQPPSAERLEYDVDTVQTLREEIKSVDWDE